MKNIECHQLTECTNCSSYGGDMFYFFRLIQNFTYQQYRFKQNSIFFFLKGEVTITGLHYPNIRICQREAIVIPAGIELDIHIGEDADCLVWRFKELPIVCEEQYGAVLQSSPTDETVTPLPLVKPLLNFIQSIMLSLEDGMLCRKYFDLKQKELVFLIHNYYSLSEVLAFLKPVLNFLNPFRHFVIQNYYKVRTVEELAILGRYGIITFRRMFKEEFGESPYRWMILQKQENIRYDLTHRDISISEIADKYLFQSLPQFSNFCKKYLGAAPREIRAQRSVDIPGL